MKEAETNLEKNKPYIFIQYCTYVKKRNVLVQLSKKACQKMWTHFFSKLVKNEGQTVLTANDFSDVWGSDSSCQQLAS